MTNLERSNTNINVKRSNTLKSLRRAGTEIKRAGTGLKRAGTGLKRAGTNGLKRTGTGLKRAGTGAWKWINAEDVKFDENSQPMGHTFFQRNDTYKRLNKLDPKFKSQQQLEEGTSPLKNDLSNESLTQDQASPSQPPQPPQPQRPQLSAYEQELEQRHREIQRQKLEERLRLQAEAAAKGEEYIIETEESPKPRRKIKDPEKEERRRSKVPKALYDPEVRKQLEELKQHKPFFMYTVTILQIALMIITLGVNFMYTGHVFDNINNNIYFGPNVGTLIHMGARYVPCMKEFSDKSKNIEISLCPLGIQGSVENNGNFKYSNNETIPADVEICNLGDLCGMGGIKEGEVPNQWVRFISPIFLHAGLIHIFINLIFQIRTGIQMEKDFGTWRMMIIYMASGIFGFVFGADISYKTPSVGCSGALYGLLACLLLDLLQNWKLIVNPGKELIKMLIIILFSLGIGLTKFIDNFAHFGGFITGILTGLIFMPTIIFGKWDLRRKRFLMVISIPILIFMFIWAFRSFYKGDSKCNWCKYVTCLPIRDWCKDL